MHPYTRLLLSAIPDYASEDDGDRALLERFRPPVEGSCAFYHRCPHATDKCKKVPELRNKAYRGEEEHLVRCFYL
jgi:oligopeptide/dipeptide ABC transporter ATP-binding protein